MTSTETILLVALCTVAAAWLLREVVRHRQARRLRALAREAEESKQQIIVEQTRNRQLKQRMTNDMAHELKTPVSSIRGYLEILLGDKPVDDERRRYFLERCYSQTLRLSDLLADVSLIGRIEESADLFPLEPVSLSATADEARNELADRLADRRVAFSSTLPDITINGNHSLLYAIFRNLLENTVAYAGEDIKAGLELYKEDPERLYLRYYDTGCGIDPKYLPVIFDRFVRIDRGRSRATGGTGLGLAIVKHAVQFHGGEIYAQLREGGGLEFFFSLRR
ncbi:MAG: HAMP domain-containing histidine kinase [Bacteroidales bacterium]|nr:HAMP domain-containing histidine kinase [Bacteroidales bacterium]